MHNTNGHTNQYTAEDIIRYLKGKMSASEMHAIEKAALEDPMLADAIEGMQLSLSRYGVKRTLAPLEKLKHKQESNKVVPVRNMKWWTIAAAASVLIIIGAVTFTYFGSNNGNEQISKKESEKKQNEVPPVITPTETFPSSTSTSDSAPSLQSAKGTEKDLAANQRQRSAIERKKSKTATDAESEQEVKAAEKITVYDFEKQAADVAGKAERDSIASTAAPEALPKSLAGRAAGISIENKNAPQRISGRVLNSSMEPLAYASLLPLNTNRSLNTDQNGNFVVTSPDSVLTVRVNAAGYQEQQFRLSNSRELNEIVLKPASQKPDEVVVTGYGNSRARKNNANSQINQVPQPVSGWVKFNEYVEKNKVYPAERNYLSGQVTLSFNINRQGRPTDIEVEEPLAKPYDDEAIRLIRQGPKWRFVKGYSEKIVVTIKF